MQKWEYCEINQCTLSVSHWKNTLFGRKLIPYVEQWEARNINTSGKEGLIYQSEIFEIGGKPYDVENARNLYRKMIAYLSSQGWEPTTTNSAGEITQMKRPVMEPFVKASTDFVDLLQQLANLKAQVS